MRLKYNIYQRTKIVKIADAAASESLYLNLKGEGFISSSIFHYLKFLM